MTTISQALEAKMVLDTRVFQKEMKKAQEVTQKTSSFMTGAWTAVGISVTQLTGKISSMLKQSLQIGLTFEQEMAAVNSLIARESAATIEKFGNDVLGLAQKLGKPPVEIAQALYQEISAGALNATGDMNAFTETVIKASVAGRATVESTARAMISVMNSYGLTLDESGRAANNFFNIVKFGVTTLPELANTIGRVVSTARAAKIEMEDWGSALAALTQLGKPTEIAITELRAAISAFIKPTQDSIKAAEEIGFELSARKLEKRGLVGALQDLNATGKTSIAVLGRLFPNIRATNAIAALSSKEGLDILTRNIDEFTRGATSMEEAFAVMTNTMGFEIAKQKSAISALAIGITKDLGPAITAIVRNFGGAVQVFLKFIKQTKILVHTFNLLAAAWNTFAAVFRAGLGGLSKGIGGFVQAIKKMGATATIVWEGMKQGFNVVAESIVATINGMVGAMRSLAEAADFIDPSGLAKKAVDSLEKVEKSLDDLSEKFKNNTKKNKKEIEAATKELAKDWKDNYFNKLGDELIKQAEDNGKSIGIILGLNKKMSKSAADESKKGTQEINKDVRDRQQFFNKAMKEESDAQFAKELAVRKQVEETVRWTERQFKIETDGFLKALKIQVSAKEKAEEKLRSLTVQRARQAESFEERLWAITMSGLTEAGKRIQKFGIADTFETRAKQALGRGDFEEARRLAEKAQAQFEDIASSQDAPEEERKRALQGFKKTQTLIEGAFQSEQNAQKDLVEQNKRHIMEMSQSLKQLQEEATIKLKFLVDSEAAQQQIDRLKDLMRVAAERTPATGNTAQLAGAPLGVPAAPPQEPAVASPRARPVFPGGEGLPPEAMQVSGPKSGDAKIQNVDLTVNFDIKQKLDRQEIREATNEIKKQLDRKFDSQRSTGSNRTKQGTGIANNGTI